MTDNVINFPRNNTFSREAWKRCDNEASNIINFPKNNTLLRVEWKRFDSAVSFLHVEYPNPFEKHAQAFVDLLNGRYGRDDRSLV